MSFRRKKWSSEANRKKKWSSDRECEERLERFSEDGPFGGVGNFGDVEIFSDGGRFGEVGKIKCL